MAKSIVQNPGDVFIHLQRDEYNALLALLSEFENSEKLKALSEREQLELTPQQCERLALLWSQLVQHKS